MKLKYFFRVLFFACMLFMQGFVSAQPILLVHNDRVVFENGNIGQISTTNVLDNDIHNEEPATLSNVTLVQIGTENPNINLSPDGSIILSQATIPNGRYRLKYQICDILIPFLCNIGTVTVFIGDCAAPEFQVSATTPTCPENFSSVIISGLPQGRITSLQYTINGSAVQTIASSPNGTVFFSASASSLLEFEYTDAVTGCRSEIVSLQIANPSCPDLGMELNGNYSDFNNDGLLNAGDTVNYQMTIVNRTNINCTMVTATSISMNIIGSFIDLLPAGTSNNSAYSGIHVITQREIDNGYINGFILLSGRNLNRTTQSVIPYSYQLTSSGMMTFNAFLDTNNNNVKDASEVDFSRGGFQYDTNNSMHNITSGAHLSLQDNNLSNTYNVGFVVDGDVAANYTISPAAYFNVSVPASGISNYNFAVHASPYTDVSTKIYAYTQPRPGFRYVNEVLFTNNSPVTLSSGNLLFTKDPLLTITDISAPDAIRTETGFSLSFSDLQPFETRQVRVTCQVPVMPTVNLGDQLTNTVTANLPAGDINTSNNNDSLTMTVIGAYDPNNKMESHGGKILHAAFGADDYLTYTIRFENTGTAHAINVKVEDMLDEKLDPASVKMTATSSNCFLDRVDNKLTWTFAAINLPPSVENTDVGKGYIAFQVKPKPGFAIGDIIPNTAEIYFDFNPAIVTDICTTEFVSALAAADFDSFGFSSYPNPVQDNWTIFSDKQLIDSVQFYDVSGKIIHSETVKNIKTTIDLSFLSNGLYFAKVISDGKSKTFKLIKA